MAPLMSRTTGKGIAMRPTTIVIFERLISAMLGLGLISTWFYRDALMPGGSIVPLAVAAVMFTLIILLTLLVSRRRSKVAMWISIVLFVLGLPALVTTMELTRRGAVTALTAGSDVLQNLLELIAYGLLFTPSARRWMNKETTLDDLGETFA
jgi:hypothetical protein